MKDCGTKLTARLWCSALTTERAPRGPGGKLIIIVVMMPGCSGAAVTGYGRLLFLK